MILRRRIYVVFLSLPTLAALFSGRRPSMPASHLLPFSEFPGRSTRLLPYIGFPSYCRVVEPTTPVASSRTPSTPPSQQTAPPQLNELPSIDRVVSKVQCLESYTCRVQLQVLTGFSVDRVLQSQKLVK